MKNNRSTSIVLHHSYGSNWTGHKNFNITEYCDNLGSLHREYIGISTSETAHKECFIPKESILAVAFFLFDLAEREGLTENKEEMS